MSRCGPRFHVCGNIRIRHRKVLGTVKTGADRRIGQNPQFSRRSGTFRRVASASKRDPTGFRYDCAPGPYACSRNSPLEGDRRGCGDMLIPRSRQGDRLGITRSLDPTRVVTGRPSPGAARAASNKLPGGGEVPQDPSVQTGEAFDAPKLHAGVVLQILFLLTFLLHF